MKINLLSDAQIQRLHEASLQILATIGVHVPHEEMLRLLAAAGAEVDTQSQRVKLPEKMVQESLDARARVSRSTAVTAHGGPSSASASGTTTALPAKRSG